MYFSFSFLTSYAIEAFLFLKFINPNTILGIYPADFCSEGTKTVLNILRQVVGKPIFI
jgi:hypothetical protein